MKCLWLDIEYRIRQTVNHCVLLRIFAYQGSLTRENPEYDSVIKFSTFS